MSTSTTNHVSNLNVPSQIILFFKTQKFHSFNNLKSLPTKWKLSELDGTFQNKLTCMTWHFDGLGSISLTLHQSSKTSRWYWSFKYESLFWHCILQPRWDVDKFPSISGSFRSVISHHWKMAAPNFVPCGTPQVVVFLVLFFVFCFVFVLFFVCLCLTLWVRSDKKLLIVETIDGLTPDEIFLLTARVCWCVRRLL